MSPWCVQHALSHDGKQVPSSSMHLRLCVLSAGMLLRYNACYKHWHTSAILYASCWYASPLCWNTSAIVHAANLKVCMLRDDTHLHAIVHATSWLCLRYMLRAYMQLQLWMLRPGRYLKLCILHADMHLKLRMLHAGMNLKVRMLCTGMHLQSWMRSGLRLKLCMLRAGMRLPVACCRASVMLHAACPGVHKPFPASVNFKLGRRRGFSNIGHDCRGNG
jgi:hypothetical protein